ncbi:hypothetical protein LWI29_034513 [Acer saccharum]|uniref:Uncharacterized protein n=1 Tax=Acer saccharum TaxID=4024 RepID=A0AA39W4X9_ACESA|nr:hypothetical protein LWI29_034513 [Acer saccharum]
MYITYQTEKCSCSNSAIIFSVSENTSNSAYGYLMLRYSLVWCSLVLEMSHLSEASCYSSSLINLWSC